MSLEGPRQNLENQLLRSLPRKDCQRLEDSLEPVYLPLKEVLCEADGPFAHVHFLTNSKLSLMTETVLDRAGLERRPAATAAES
jgi:hypothetical protein